MTTAMTAEGYLGLSAIMLAMLLANLSVSRMLSYPWKSGPLEADYLNKTVEGYFMLAAAGMAVVILSFLGLLISMFAAFPTAADPKTFGFIQDEAAGLFYGAACGTVLIGAIGVFIMLRKAMANEQPILTPLLFVGIAFSASGPIFALLSFLLVLTGAGTSINADYFFGGQLIFFGSVVGWVANTMFSGWFERQIEDTEIDTKALSSSAGKRALISVILAGAPMVSGLFVIAG